MKAKIIKKGTPVLLKQKRTVQGSVVSANPFMHKKRMCVRLVGFKSVVPVNFVEVI
jgi:hypothetical protein